MPTDTAQTTAASTEYQVAEAPEPTGTTPARKKPTRPTALKSTAPPLGEKQGQARFQVRLTPTLLEAVDENTARIALATGMTRNQVRQVAVWAILGSNTDQALADAFVRDVIPDWNRARQNATQRQQRDDRADANSSDARS